MLFRIYKARHSVKDRKNLDWTLFKRAVKLEIKLYKKQEYCTHHTILYDNFPV
jgi:hypothetical protein